MDKSHHKSIQVFKNPILEKYLTHVHPTTPFVFWIPIALWMGWRCVVVEEMDALSIGLSMTGGFFTWTITEYFLHRFVFHFEGKGPVLERLHFLLHGIHHADPIDPTRLVMPPAVSSLLGLILFLFYRVILGGYWVQPFFIGFVLGYLFYDFTHYAVHHFTPRSQYGKMLKQHHMQHHFVDPNSKWGVSSPFWDYVFGTIETVKEKRRSSV